ncbi:GvpL/GvpF family gas vesicle protein [Nocardia sp. CDC153]|uniref:GvpL/GvpF family gas vesicle protein n=1 Tax=Nocardia sp. CDC153 TaxID=3112167 RepID=UPI002DB8EF43|nr:GvpL/GvpF family gas vesicle protein [Nocardia sp. CDC153]MEC3957457.1 GvpL/GvpF family gas vesicle protein [Nocardia sp. CDC153]
MTSETAVDAAVDTGTALWMYAIRDGNAPAPEVTGVSNEPVRCVCAGGLAAVVGSVPLRQFNSAALERNLNDFDWLADAARAHHAVIGAAAQERPVIPIRLAVLCRDEGSVRRLLIERHQDFRTALALVEGRAEWGVRAYLRPPGDNDDRPRPASGADYLRQRRDALQRNRTDLASAELAASTMFRALCRHAVAARCRPSTDSTLTGRRAHLVLNAAYLVDMSKAADFLAAAQEFDDHELLVIERSGPWPPYTFVGAAGEL